MKPICDTCRTPVLGGKGYIHVDTAKAWLRAEAAEHRALLKVIESDGVGRAVGAGDLLKEWDDFEASTPESRWEVHHRACDPNPQRDDYWFDVARAATEAHLLDWTLHLSGKIWLDGTNWVDFVRALLAASGRPAPR